jgi:hypothetical protein
MTNTKKDKLFKNQLYHLLAWIALGGLLYMESRRYADAGAFKVWGLSANRWLLISWILAFLHQGWIWLFWRLELFYGKVSQWLGDRGFLLYRIGFVTFALTRLLSLVLVAFAAPDTLSLPRPLSLGLIIVTTPPILWGIYSVAFYFGVTRAFGADHFHEKYRGGSLEVRGIFKYIPNSMYTVVLLAIYHPALLVHSRLGFMAALAHHLMVWTHYFCTEKPDMAIIYGDNSV